MAASIACMPLSADLPAHTWRRNSNSIALACVCMGGQPDPWTAADITIQSVMTHAEAASN